MTIQEAASRTYRIGRDVTRGTPTYAFSIRRREDGGISILNIRDTPSPAERSALFSHFGSPISFVTGGEDEDGFYTEKASSEAGTPEHFVAAICAIPSPFILLPSKD